jgi:hypothetical protein
MKLSKKLLVLIVCFSLITIPAFTFCDEPEKIEKVIVTGVGIDAGKAKQNAIRNAVEQVVGSYISSDTMVKNNTVLKDKVLGYSGGYVKDIKVLSQEKTDDNLFAVKIETNVISTKLKRKLEDLNITAKKVEGDSLFGEAVTRIENQLTGQEMLDKILSKYPQAAYSFEIGKPLIVSTNPKSGKARIRIPLSIKWDQAFVSELKDVLSKVAKIELKSAEISSFGNGPNIKYLRGNKVVCFSGKRTIRSGRADACEVIGIQGEKITERKTKKIKGGRDNNSNKPPDWLKKLDLLSLITGEKPEVNNEELINPSGGTPLEFDKKSLLNLPISSEAMTLLFKFKDKSEQDIDAATYSFKYQDTDSPQNQEILPDRRDSSSYTLAVYLKGDPHTPPNTLWHDSHSRHILILTDGIFKISPEVDIDVRILKEITKIEVNMNSWQR